MFVGEWVQQRESKLTGLSKFFAADIVSAMAVLGGNEIANSAIKPVKRGKGMMESMMAKVTWILTGLLTIM